jgi:hypothetical protein
MPILKSCVPCPDVVTAQTVYLNILLPSGYRYFFEFLRDDTNQVLLDHPSDLYLPVSVSASWAAPAGTNGIFLNLGVTPSFDPFKVLNVRIHISQDMYEVITSELLGPVVSVGAQFNPLASELMAFMQYQLEVTEGTYRGQNESINQVNPTASLFFDFFQYMLDVTPERPVDMVPPLANETSGSVDYIIVSTDEGSQIKVDLARTSPYPPEDPVTVQTLTWNEPLFRVERIQEYDFLYVPHGSMGITFPDPRFCFLRQWITFPQAWTVAIKKFAAIQ